MCGIVGLFLKRSSLEPELGAWFSEMLICMSSRGPDSAGFAVYGDLAPPGKLKVTLQHSGLNFDWSLVAVALERRFRDKPSVDVNSSHARFLVKTDVQAIRDFLRENFPEVRIMSVGRRIEIMKETGLPESVVERFSVRKIAGSHAIGHTRMATESAVTTEGSHPFSTGLDLCLVHNGSLSNHNRLRRRLCRQGVEFHSENDTEVAAGYFAWQLANGATLKQALEAGLGDLDGFYTFTVGTEDGFAVLRDPIACKPAVLAETDDYVAMAGMTAEERRSSKILVYQYLPSRYGMNPHDLRSADAIEIVLGQGAKPGGGGMLLGRKLSDRVAEMRTLPGGIDQRSACRHPDWTGPDDLAIKIEELREITDWEKPIYVKVAASRTYFDVQLAVKAGADVIVLDGMQGGTGATQEVFIEHVGIPTLPALRQAVEALVEMGMHRKVQLIISGGIRSGADVAKALAMGADAVSIGTAALIALGCNSPKYENDYRKLGTAAGFYDDYQDGNDPAGISTQDPELAKRLDPVIGGRRLANYLRVLTMEAQTIARACGKSHVLNLEPEDLVALTVEAAAMAKVPLAGTDWIPGASRKADSQ